MVVIVSDVRFTSAATSTADMNVTVYSASQSLQRGTVYRPHTTDKSNDAQR